MKTIATCENSNKSVRFINNAGYSIMVFAMQDDEYWFSIGHFQTLSGAKRSARRQMANHGYKINEKELASVEV